ncbi:hypothetical protein NC651_030527 [Populus alba x Populus x berolinensis]|nr:hypothetical protein NC651_030527 [Populus alba x Populus x berolinensis]
MKVSLCFFVFLVIFSSSRLWSSASELSGVPLCICGSQVSLALDCCGEVQQVIVMLVI